MLFDGLQDNPLLFKTLLPDERDRAAWTSLSPGIPALLNKAFAALEQAVLSQEPPAPPPVNSVLANIENAIRNFEDGSDCSFLYSNTENDKDNGIVPPDHLLDKHKNSFLPTINELTRPFNTTDLAGEDLEDILEELVKGFISWCNKRKCREMRIEQYPGNPDIVGVGMLAGFAMQLFINIIVFRLPLFLRRTLSNREIAARAPEPPSPVDPKQSITSRFFNAQRQYEAINHLTPDFHSSVTIFALSVSIASWILAAKSSATAYDIDASTLVMVLQLCSVFSSKISLLGSGLVARRKKLRRYADIFLICISSGFLLFVYVQISRQTDRFNPSLPWECRNYGMSITSMRSKIHSGLILLPPIWGVAYLAFRFCFTAGIGKITIKGGVVGWGIVMTIYRLIIDIFGCVALGLVIGLRREAKKAWEEGNEDLSGSSDPWSDDEWGFGQILAVFIWAPLLIDYGYLVIVGVREGLTSKLSEGLIVIAEDKKDSENDEESGEVPEAGGDMSTEGNASESVNASEIVVERGLAPEWIQMATHQGSNGRFHYDNSS